jgi:uncharacterized protein (TIGR00730 family)
MKNMTESKYLCVYCGASERVAPQYYKAAEDLGKLIADNNFSMVYGGGRLGLMGRVSNAVIENGGIVVGITTEHLDAREGVQVGLHKVHVVDTMHTRKYQMSERADAFIIMPGGFGTLDEFFEILTWRQLNLHQKPIIIANINGYWDSLVALFHHVINTEFARKEHEQFLHVETTIDGVIETAKRLLG